ncbi:MAG: helix-turn-helix transcriptional regulator, partial [Acidimicrobiia bacterium]|nr:helix-turn-helix transcriptional regulator [Acidimicrobiia bacterium]
MIELAVLGVLREGELHGYELRKRLRELVGGTSSISFGSLYPALGRLERDGAVEAVEAVEQLEAAVPVATVPST